MDGEPPSSLPPFFKTTEPYLYHIVVGVLDRILLAYHLSIDINQQKVRQESRHKKLGCLFEFLGAGHLPGKQCEVREEDPHRVRHERSGVSGW